MKVIKVEVLKEVLEGLPNEDLDMNKLQDLFETYAEEIVDIHIEPY